MPIDPNDQFQQQDAQRRLDETRLRDQERRERTRRFDDDERDERERLDRERRGKAERDKERGGWRSLFGLRRTPTDATRVEPAIEAGQPAQTPAKTPAAPVVTPVPITARSSGRARTVLSIGTAALVLAGVSGFTTWQRSHGSVAPGTQPLATADAAVVAQPLAAESAGAPTRSGVPEESDVAIPVADTVPAHDTATTTDLPAPRNSIDDSTNAASTEPSAVAMVAAAPAERAATPSAEIPAQTATAQLSKHPGTTPATAVTASKNEAPHADTAPVVARATPTTRDAALSAPASAAQDAAIANATNQVAALNTRVEALQAQLLVLQTAQQAAKAAPAETAPAAARPVRPRKPVRKATRAPAHETPEPSIASTRTEPKLLAIDSWGGKPSVVVGIEQADGSADTRIRTLQPGDTLSGITLRSVNADAGRAVFDVGGGHAVTLNLEPR